jgi:serine/threonine-protein kinase
MTPWSLSPGVVLGARYRLVAPLGRGSMGEVWRAQHVSLGVEVAIKTIDPQLFARPGAADARELFERFQREAQAAAALQSAHVVKVLDHGIERGMPYIAMELLVGETLGERLARQGRLGFEETVRVMTHVARAIGRAHELGIVHRDLKPQNVFLTRGDDGELAKVLDFGIAKVLRSPLHTDTNETAAARLIGTPAYMSPELLSGQSVVDARVDLWAMAMLTFECVIGRLPVVSNNVGELVLAICTRPMPMPSSLAPVPPAFDAWFARATARDPSQRFPTAKAQADALAQALAPHLSAQPGALGPVGPAMPQTHAGLASSVAAPPQPSRATLLFAAVGIGLVLGFSGLVILKLQLDKSGAHAAASASVATSKESAAPSVAVASATAADSATAATSSVASAAPSASASAAPSASAPTRPRYRPRVDPRLGL